MPNHDPDDEPRSQHVPALMPSAADDAQAENEAPREETATETFLREMEEDLPPGYLHFPQNSLLHQLLKDGCYAPLCSPFRVRCRLRTPEGTGWSVVINVLDLDERIHEVILSAVALNTRPAAVVTALVNVGLDLRGKAADLLSLIKTWDVATTGYLANRAGWFEFPGDASLFLLPDGAVYGRQPDGDVVRLAAVSPRPTSGTLHDWQASIGCWAVGNPALIAGVAMGFAGPLLGPSGLDALGINLHSTTSSGKSTIARAARSTSGNPEELPRWNTTSAGRELLTTAAHDALLVFDEFPALPDKSILDTIYAIGNATSRTRGTSAMTQARTVHSRTALLSTSEKPIHVHFAESGLDQPGGIDIRLIDIPASAWRHGVFDELHGHVSGHAFATAIKVAAEANYGHALPAFIDWLVPRIGKLEAEQLPAMLKMFERAAIGRLGPLNGPSQRVIARLGLVAIAGELASRAGVLPWRTKTAWNALLEIAELWHAAALKKRAEGAEGMMDRLAALVRTPDRFTSLREGIEAEGEFAGWVDDEHIYLDCDVFAEIAGNRSPQEVARYLRHSGHLVPGGEARSFQYRLPRRYFPDRPRTYRLRRDRFEA